MLDPSVWERPRRKGGCSMRVPVASVQRLEGPPAAGPVEPFVPDWLVEQTAAGRVAEHRAVTVGFVFFGGADALLAEQGPEVLHERLQALASATKEATARHGGSGSPATSTPAAERSFSPPALHARPARTRTPPSGPHERSSTPTWDFRFGADSTGGPCSWATWAPTADRRSPSWATP